MYPWLDKTDHLQNSRGSLLNMMPNKIHSDNKGSVLVVTK